MSKENYDQAFICLKVALSNMYFAEDKLEACNNIECWSEQKNGQLELIIKNLNDLITFMYE